MRTIPTSAVGDRGINRLGVYFDGVSRRERRLLVKESLSRANVIGNGTEGSGTTDSDRVNQLIKQLSNKNKHDICYAAYKLACIGKAASPAVPKLIELLSNKNEDICAWAAFTLGFIGEKAYQAIPKLKDLLSDKNFSVRDQAKEALRKLINYQEHLNRKELA